MSNSSVDFDLRDLRERKEKREADKFEPNKNVGFGTIAAKNGDVFTGSPNMVWVQTEDGITAALLPMGNSTKPVAGTPVRFARDPKTTDPLKITGINSDSAAAYAGFTPNQPPPHWYTHHYMNGEVIGSDVGLIHPRMIELGRLTPAGGYKVVLSPFVIYRSGIRYPIQGFYFDLEIDKPMGVNEQLWVTIYLNLQTRQYGKSVGAVYSGEFTPDYPTVPESTLVMGSVRLRGSVAEIREVDIVDGRVPFDIPPDAFQTIPLDPDLDFTTMVNGDMLWFDAANHWYTSMGLTEPPGPGQVVAWNSATNKPSYMSLEEVEDGMAREILSAAVEVTTTTTVIAPESGKKIALVGVVLEAPGPMKVQLKQSVSGAAITGAMDLAVKGNGFVYGNGKNPFHTTAIDQGISVVLAQSLFNPTSGYPFTVSGIISYYLV